ncbi:hypothetical protein RhiXN_04805 [Rhizoctonia solani]|uniref:Uncharacterized protein n=1 Tax=Rhizoctonia solani TaxID=456999 RepID=A0A8H8NQD6_9AGAM|nr:uncharacterized protein RhiXN_04805 [Rhizoctonia solani]QRW16803.1 hypothetical protein RhiXN_04805 [Rhizoctonia solani]
MCALSIYRTPMHSELGWYSAAVVICVVSMAAWYTPGGSKVAEWVWNGVEVYCEMLAVLTESVATVFTFSGTGSHTIPGAYPLDAQVEEWVDIKAHISQSANIFLTDDNNTIPGASSRPQSRYQHAKQTNYTIPTGRHVRLPNGSLDRPKAPANNKTTQVDRTSITTVSLISASRSSSKSHRVRKYAKMQTLKLPGKPPRPIHPPTENELLIQQAKEEVTIEIFQRDKYCVRELAGSGIFVHTPTTRTRNEPGVLQYCHTVHQARRETAIGPMSGLRKNRQMEIPTIKISEPSDTSADFTENESGSPYIPPKVLFKAIPKSSSPPVFISTSTSIPDTYDKPVLYHTPFNKSTPRRNTKDEDTTRVQQGQYSAKNRASMSEWLATISAGSNPLVAEHVAKKAGPMLRASLILSPPFALPPSPTYSTSSSDSSGPGTPIDGFSLSPNVLEKSQVMEGPGDRRWRARCNYLGDGYDIVVAPVIPEELHTDEIGVAC